MTNYPELLKFCEARELGSVGHCVRLAAVIEHGSTRKAARALGVHHAAVDVSIKKLRKAAAGVGYDPENGLDIPVAIGNVPTGHSAMWRDGKKVIEWVKQSPERQHMLEQLRIAIEAMCDPIKPRRPKKAPRTKWIDEAVTIYPLADVHFGMAAYASETGVEDWDVPKATRALEGGIGSLVAEAIETRHAVVANLGDFFHADNKEGTTRNSGNPLDCDLPWAQVAKLGADSLIACINIALEKHETIEVRNIPGNHDCHGVIGLGIALNYYYRNEPRVEVNLDEGIFQKLRIGNCLRGLYHGHTANPQKLDGVMANFWPVDWGETVDREWYTGHIHQANDGS